MSPSTLARLSTAATFFFFITLIIVPPVHSVCCCRCGGIFAVDGCECNHTGLCNGVGKCNVACCNCDGGCWKDVINSFPYQNATVIAPKVRFAEFDTDTDGFISMEDISGLTAWNDIATARQQFVVMDDDGDGKLSYREFEKHA